jgi:hypothetical protein
MYSRGLSDRYSHGEIRLPPAYSGSAFRVLPTEEKREAPPLAEAVREADREAEREALRRTADRLLQNAARTTVPVPEEPPWAALPAPAEDRSSGIVLPAETASCGEETTTPAFCAACEEGTETGASVCATAAASETRAGGFAQGLRRWLSGWEGILSGETLLLLGLLLILLSRDPEEGDCPDSVGTDDLLLLLAVLLFLS